MAARREELGEPPTPEELLAYRDGRLSPEERDRMEDRLAVWPDAARTLADIAAFPNVEPAPGTPELSDDDITARWQSFRQRLPDRPAQPPVAKPLPALPPVASLPTSVRRRWAPGFRLAAAALVGLAVGWGLGAGRTGREAAGPAINATLAELSPAGGGARSEPKVVELREGSEEAWLMLDGDPSAEWDFGAYEAEAFDEAGRPAWARQGLRPTDLGTFYLSFPRSALKPGRYRIDLYGRDHGERTLLATYAFRVLEAAPAP
jgi:hypothetical protein